MANQPQVIPLRRDELFGNQLLPGRNGADVFHLSLGRLRYSMIEAEGRMYMAHTYIGILSGGGVELLDGTSNVREGDGDGIMHGYAVRCLDSFVLLLAF